MLLCQALAPVLEPVLVAPVAVVVELTTKALLVNPDIVSLALLVIAIVQLVAILIIQEINLQTLHFQEALAPVDVPLQHLLALQLPLILTIRYLLVIQDIQNILIHVCRAVVIYQ